MTDLDRIETAMYATANRLGGGTLLWEDDWVQLTTPDAKTDYRNVVYRSVLTEDELDARISEVIEQHRELGVAFRWWTTPSTRPRDTDARLVARGFEQVDEVEGMVADATAFPEPANTDVEVIRIGPDQIDEWVDTCGRGWGMPESGQARFRTELQLELAKPKPAAHYFLARWQGLPAGASALTCLDGYAHFAGSVVVPDLRRRGIYREMIYARMQYLRSIGVTMVTNTCVKSTSAPICAKLGFRKICDTQIFRHPGGS